MARSFTIPTLRDAKGKAITMAYCRAWRADTHALVETQYTDANGDATFSALPDNVDCSILCSWHEGHDSEWFFSEAPPTLGDLDGNLDDIADGTTYGKLKINDLTVGRIDFDKIQQGTTYSKVLTADMSAGHILLSSVTQSSGYRTVSNTEKNTWNAKPDDMDEIANGATYGKLLLTDISAGHLKLTSSTVVSGEWYDESGVEIDATHGINIYGTANALTTRATKTGTIQCYVGTDGAIYAGAGAVKLDALGISMGARQQMLIFLGDDSYKSYIYSYSTDNRDLRIMPSGKIWMSGDTMIASDYYIYPQSNASADVGDATHMFSTVFAYFLNLRETTTPTALADSGKLYTKADNKLYFQDGAGTEHTVAFD